MKSAQNKLTIFLLLALMAFSIWSCGDLFKPIQTVSAEGTIFIGNTANSPVPVSLPSGLVITSTINNTPANPVYISGSILSTIINSTSSPGKVLPCDPVTGTCVSIDATGAMKTSSVFNVSSIIVSGVTSVIQFSSATGFGNGSNNDLFVTEKDSSGNSIGVNGNPFYTQSAGGIYSIVSASGSTNHVNVDVLPSIPAGGNIIGSISNASFGISGAIPSGGNVIGGVTQSGGPWTTTNSNILGSPVNIVNTMNGTTNVFSTTNPGNVIATQASGANLHVNVDSLPAFNVGSVSQGSVTTNAPTYVNGTLANLSLDTSGQLRVNPGLLTPLDVATAQIQFSNAAGYLNGSNNMLWVTGNTGSITTNCPTCGSLSSSVGGPVFTNITLNSTSNAGGPTNPFSVTPSGTFTVAMAPSSSGAVTEGSTYAKGTTVGFLGMSVYSTTMPNCGIGQACVGKKTSFHATAVALEDWLGNLFTTSTVGTHQPLDVNVVATVGGGGGGGSVTQGTSPWVDNITQLGSVNVGPLNPFFVASGVYASTITSLGSVLVSSVSSTILGTIPANAKMAWVQSYGSSNTTRIHICIGLSPCTVATAFGHLIQDQISPKQWFEGISGPITVSAITDGLSASAQFGYKQ